MTQIVYNSLKSSDLDITVLQEPGATLDVTPTRLSGPSAAPVAHLPSQLAFQINDARRKFSPPMEAVDLADMIADVIIETSAQGASLLEVHVIDPFWALLQRDPKTGGSFIDVDPSGDGFLWPPIEVNFPQDVSDSRWRLCQCKPSTDLTQANMILTFEDAIVAEMREHDALTDSSLGASNPNETRAEFIQRCIRTINLKPLATDPQHYTIRLITDFLDPSNFTINGLTGAETTLPASSTLQNTIAGIRNNPRDPAKSSKVDTRPRTGVGRTITGVPTQVSLSTGSLDYALQWAQYTQGILDHPGQAGGGTEAP